MMTFRHLLAILLLPFTVVVLVPTWLLTSWAEADTRWTYLWAPGAVLFALGLALFAWCVGLFGRVGQGPLHPGTRRRSWLRWAPTNTCAIR